MAKTMAKKNKPREILLHGVIGWDFTSRDFALAVASSGDDEIILRINSVGGDYFDGVAMYNALYQRDGVVTAVVEGIAASAASVVAMGAGNIKMRRGATMMIHNPWALAIGDAAVMAKAAEDLDKLAGTAADIYAARSGKSVAEVMALMSDETLMTGAEAVEMGFADEALSIPRETVVALEQTVVQNKANVPHKLKAALMTMASADNHAAQAAVLPVDDAKDDAPPPGAENKEKDGAGEKVPDAAQQTQPADGAVTTTTEATPAPAPAPAPSVQAQGMITSEYAREVVALCVRAKRPQLADGYLEKATPIETVRAELLDALCSEQEATPVDSRRPAAVANADDPFGWEKRLRAAGAYQN